MLNIHQDDLERVKNGDAVILSAVHEPDSRDTIEIVDASEVDKRCLFNQGDVEVKDKSGHYGSGLKYSMLEYYTDPLDSIRCGGDLVTLSDGVTLWQQDEIIAHQADWSDSDSAKNVDFTTHKYWVTAIGTDPKGYDDLEDVASEYRDL